MSSSAADGHNIEEARSYGKWSCYTSCFGIWASIIAAIIIIIVVVNEANKAIADGSLDEWANGVYGNNNN